MVKCLREICVLDNMDYIPQNSTCPRQHNGVCHKKTAFFKKVPWWGILQMHVPGQLGEQEVNQMDPLSDPVSYITPSLIASPKASNWTALCIWRGECRR